VAVRNNEVTQDGSIGRNFLMTSNSDQNMGNITITVEGNRFAYTGASGMGVVTKSASLQFKLLGNRFENGVISLLGNNKGTVEISGNQLHFSRIVEGMDAIAAGNNHFSSLVIRQNEITSNVLQAGEASAATVRRGPPCRSGFAGPELSPAEMNPIDCRISQRDWLVLYTCMM
jgi:hypothetical protein